MRGGCSRKRLRAQVSMEYLFIMGFAMLLTLPLIIVYFTQTQSLAEEANSASAARAATQMGEAADTVYYLGEPSARTITVDFPDGIQSVSLSDQSITLVVDSSNGDFEQVASTAANLTGSITASPGPHVLLFTAISNDRVNVSER